MANPITGASNRPIRHAAHWPYQFALILLVLIVIMAYVTVFIPWAVKDLAVGQRAYAFPFKVCIEDTFSKSNLETCQDNDLFANGAGVPISGGNEKCAAFFLCVIAFVILTLLVGVILIFVLWYIIENLWRHPLVLCYITNVVLVFHSCFCYLTWVFFIIYMEYTCAPNSIFPVSPGYSYGFIMFLFISLLSSFAVGCGIWGTRRMILFKRNDKFLLDIEGPPAEYLYPVASSNAPWSPVALPPRAGTPINVQPEVYVPRQRSPMPYY